MTDREILEALLNKFDKIDGRMEKLELRLENEAFAPIRILSENVADLAKRQLVTEESISFLVKNH